MSISQLLERVTQDLADESASDVVESPTLPLSRDLRQAAATLTTGEARYLVSLYYQFQAVRIGSAAQYCDLSSNGEPNGATLWTVQNMKRTELAIKSFLGVWSTESTLGRWLRSIPGIGPVIASGLLAYSEGETWPTAGHLWSYAGLNPERTWLGGDKARAAVTELYGSARELTRQQIEDLARSQKRNPEHLLSLVERPNQKGTGGLPEGWTSAPTKRVVAALAKRPWSAEFKTICVFKAGESFVKIQNNPRDIYGRLFRERRDMEARRNEQGEFAYAAERALSEKRYGADTMALAAYSQGRLPDAHLHARARRYAVKIFLSHYHEMWYWITYGRLTPAPFALEFAGHAHYIQPPNLDLVPGLREAKVAAGQVVS